MNICGIIIMNMQLICSTPCNIFFFPRIYEGSMSYVSTVEKRLTPLVGLVIIGPTMFTTMLGDNKCVEMRLHGLHGLSTYPPPNVPLPRNSGLYLGGGLKVVLFASLFGENSHFDSYFLDGLVQPPTSYDQGL